MKLEVGMYVRTKRDGIGKIISLSIGEEDECCFIELSKRRTGIKEHNILKASHNIIDLIEEGDYVNGYKVSFKDNDYKPFVQCDYPVQAGTTNHYRFYEEAIYSIVTSQQFSAMEYRLGDK